jgi:hypothetical protein
MIRDRVLGFLADTQGGASASEIAEECGFRTDAETAAAFELLCHYAPELIKENDRWKVAKAGRSSQILAAIESYALSSGKKIFRLSTALASIPAHEHPAEEELKQALEMSHGRFQLLANAMIKKND